MSEERVIVELTADMTGTYLLTTRSGSRYLVEIDGSGLAQIQRTPAAFTVSGDWSPSLYSDGEALTCRIDQMKVGQTGAFIYIKPELAMQDPDYFGSTRFTTIIESIEAVACS